jgi:uncharacterized delta-60 repeat protein
MKKLQLTFQIITLSIFLTLSIFGNIAQLDTTYNGTGYSINPVPVSAQFSIIAKSFALQPDGKAVIGGYISHSEQQIQNFVIMRLNADGSLDTSFGDGGTVLTNVENGVAEGYVLIQSDGKILMAGTSKPNDGTFRNYAVVRYTTDGQLDTTFNNTGYVSHTISGNSVDQCFGAVLQPDGKIVLTGETDEFPSVISDVGVMRLNTDGSLDTTFNGTGILKIGSPANDEAGYAVSVQPDGKIIVGGTEKISKNNYLLARLNTDGTLDNSFGNGGVTITSADFGTNIFTAAAVLPGGKILASGSGAVRGFLARYNTDGTLDNSFGIGGLNPSEGSANKILILNDHKYFVIGTFGGTRHLENGAIDTKFSVRPVVPGVSCNTTGAAIVNDNKIIFGGACSPTGSGTISSFAAFRYQEIKTKRFLDFNGDERTDLSVYNPTTARWTIRNVSTATTTHTQFGLSTDRLAPADFTGDGRTDIAVFRPSTGEWLILRSENGTFYSIPFGISEDIPVAADYDGDQIDDIAVFRPSLNTWFIRNSTGGISIENFGSEGDKPVPSDYDGDFKTDIAIYRPSNGQWWIHRSSDGSIYAFEFGTAADKPVQGDYTGDGKTDAAFWRPSTGEWFILRSEDYSYYAFPWGLGDDLPAPGNHGGDARFDAAVYRPSTNRWYFLRAEGDVIEQVFGTPGDLPIPNFFVP